MKGSGKNRGDPSGERLHVCTGYTCNNNCMFCMEASPTLHSRRVGIMTAGNIEKLLREFRGTSQVMFTSGEPTTNPLLPDFVSMAQRLGYRQIGLTTNGRMLAYERYAEELVQRGLNRIIFSIHEADARRHDALSRTPGSFRQSITGLKNASELKKRYHLEIHTSTVITKRNVNRMEAIYKVLGAFPVEQIVFNIVKPEGRVLSNISNIVPRYTEVRDSFECLLDAIPEAAGRALLLELPPCLPVKGAGGGTGYLEEFLMFDGDDEPAVESKMVLKEAHGGKIFKNIRVGQGRIKRKLCEDCAYFRRCWGVPLMYIRQFGWAEFQSVRREEAAG